MDPLQMLLAFLRSVAPSADAFAAMEAKVDEIFKSFALVPKHEFEAHLQILETLKSQVAELEARLDELNKG